MACFRFFLTHPRVLSFGVLLTLFSSFGQTFLISIFVPPLLSRAPRAGASQAAQAAFLRRKLRTENLYPLLWNSRT
jgi:hypothetical protein